MKIWIHWKPGSNIALWIFIWGMALVLGPLMGRAVWFNVVRPFLFGPGVG